MRGDVTINSKLKILLATAGPVVILDQVSKALIMGAYHSGQITEVVRGFFSLVYFENPGAAFSLFHSGGTLRTLLLIGVTLVSLVVVAFLLRESKSALLDFALSLVAGGAVGNLIDRVRFGHVVDFLSFHIGRYHWPAFNVADSAITCGAVLAVYSYYFKGRGA